jgi:hypothetical protein
MLDRDNLRRVFLDRSEHVIISTMNDLPKVSPP